MRSDPQIMWKTLPLASAALTEATNGLFSLRSDGITGMSDHLTSPFKKLRVFLIDNPPPPTAIRVTRDSGIVGARKLQRQFAPVQKHTISRQGSFRCVGNPSRQSCRINRTGNQIHMHVVAITDPVRGCCAGQQQCAHGQDRNEKKVHDKMGP